MLSPKRQLAKNCTPRSLAPPSPWWLCTKALKPCGVIGSQTPFSIQAASELPFLMQLFLANVEKEVREGYLPGWVLD